MKKVKFEYFGELGHMSFDAYLWTHLDGGNKRFEQEFKFKMTSEPSGSTHVVEFIPAAPKWFVMPFRNAGEILTDIEWQIRGFGGCLIGGRIARVSSELYEFSPSSAEMFADYLENGDR